MLPQRVATRRNKYFYNPIYGTPFSLALALPEGYGMYETVGEEEIKRSTVNRQYLPRDKLIERSRNEPYT